MAFEYSEIWGLNNWAALLYILLQKYIRGGLYDQY